MSEGSAHFPLTTREFQLLGTYNAEVARGLVHTDEWRARMAGLQRRWDTDR